MRRARDRESRRFYARCFVKAAQAPLGEAKLGELGATAQQR